MLIAIHILIKAQVEREACEDLVQQMLEACQQALNDIGYVAKRQYLIAVTLLH